MGSSGTEFVGQSSTAGATGSCRSIGCRKYHAVRGRSCRIDHPVITLHPRMIRFYDCHEHKKQLILTSPRAPNSIFLSSFCVMTRIQYTNEQSNSIKKHTARLFQIPFDESQEFYSFSTIDDPMIISQSNVHHLSKYRISLALMRLEFRNVNLPV